MISAGAGRAARAIIVALMLVLPVVAQAEYANVDDYEYVAGPIEVSADRGIRHSFDDGK